MVAVIQRVFRSIPSTKRSVSASAGASLNEANIISTSTKH
jgi:hypothetical protein